jgi:hypothetical protein
MTKMVRLCDMLVDRRVERWPGLCCEFCREQWYWNRMTPLTPQVNRMTPLTPHANIMTPLTPQANRMTPLTPEANTMCFCVHLYYFTSMTLNESISTVKLLCPCLSVMIGLVFISFKPVQIERVTVQYTGRLFYWTTDNLTVNVWHVDGKYE